MKAHRSRGVRCLLVLRGFLAAAVPVAAVGLASGQTFSGLGALPGMTYSYGFGVSGDGLTAVGYSDHAYRWTAGVMQDLGTLPGGITSQAWAASQTGAFITGNSDTGGSFSAAFRWSGPQGMVNLGTLGTSAFGLAISADGAVVVGRSGVMPSGNFHAFRWTAESAMQDLGVFEGDNASVATAASADGSVVVGYSVGYLSTRPFRWTSATGMVDLGLLPGGNLCYATAVSGDGATIAGWGTSASGSTAFIWTAESNTLTPLGTLPNGSGSVANAISADGATVVGRADDAGFSRAFLWTDAGMVDLNTYLPTLGGNLTGWTLTSANGVSGDGRTIVGSGTHNGSSEAWIAELPAPSHCGTADFNGDGDVGTDADIEAFFACLAGSCCASCDPHGADFNGDGDVGTDADIDSFFRVLAGGPC